MKKLFFLKNYFFYILSLCIILSTSFLFSSCDENSENKNDKLVGAASFLEKPENEDFYSEFVALIRAAEMFELLNSDAVFTCFIPTNQAMQKFYNKYDISLEKLSIEEAREIINEHIIEGEKHTKPFDTDKFPLNPIPTPNLNNEYIHVEKDEYEYESYFTVNYIAEIIKENEVVKNGIIHTIDKVLLVLPEKKTVSFFLKSFNEELYSEFAALIKAADMYDFLDSDGVFTCFIPTNEAMRNFYTKKNISLEKLSVPEAEKIVKAHIISGKPNSVPLKTIDFPLGSILTPDLNDNFINISIGKRVVDGDLLSVWVVNYKANIIMVDEMVDNGIIHTIDQVLDTSLSETDKILNELTDFSIFYEAMKLTEMTDSLYLEENETYTYSGKKYNGAGPSIDTPLFCKYGYTILMESNETFAKNGIYTLDDLIRYSENIYYKMFPLNSKNEESVKNNYTHRENALNRFVSYHMMDRMINLNEFIPDCSSHFIDGVPIKEYIEMMMPNSMIEVQTGNIINKTSKIVDPYSDIKILNHIASASNTIFLEINSILTYEDVESKVFNKRLRIDVASMFSELTTNKIKYSYPFFVIPREFFSGNNRISYSEKTQLQYIGHTNRHSMYGDEFIFRGNYDFTLMTPPIPKGKWEIRIGYTASKLRGIAQVFVDKKPCEESIDFRILGTDPEIGWAADEITSDNGVENDIKMRNNGYMKAPASIVQAVSHTPLRDFEQSLRKIISTIDIETTRSVSIRIKTVLEDTSQEFMIDYIEFVPVSYLEIEDRY